MPTNDRDRGGRGGHETETDVVTTTKTHRMKTMKTKKTKTVQHPFSKPIRNITNTEDILYTHNIYSVMATRRHKIARSAIRRVKRRNSKNTKLRTLRSRKNTTEKKARLNMRKMRGGGDFRIFMVCFDKPTVSTHECISKTMVSGNLDGVSFFKRSRTLVGTLCYYPGNSDFYFCGYNEFSPISTITKYDIVHKIICQLCGIAEDSPAGVALKTRLNGTEGGILEFDEKKTDNYTTKRIGKQPNDLVDYCIRLNNPRFMPKLELSFLQRHREITRIPKTKSDGEIKTDIHNNVIYDVYDKTTADNVPICKIDSKPPILDSADFFKLLDIGNASVFLDEYTPYVDGAETLDSRAKPKISAIDNGRGMFNFVRNNWVNDRWTKYKNKDN